MRLLLSLLVLALLPTTALASKAHAPYWLDATSNFNPYANETAWIEAHSNLVNGYGSFAKEHYVNKGLPTEDYHDAATEGYAPLTPTTRANYMKKVEADKAQGFVGVENDDVNLNLSFRDGHQNKSSYEPEAKELAALVEQERTFWPEAIITTNTQWHDLAPLLASKDPNAEKIVANSTQIYKEFGVGPTAGINTKAEWETLVSFEETHRMIFGGDYNSPRTVDTEEYNLATMLMGNNGYVSSCCEKALPPTFSKVDEAEVGEPVQAKWNDEGKRSIYSRTLTWEGPFGEPHIDEVLVNPPGGTTESWHLLGWMGTSTEWGTVNEVTLKPKQGAVLRG